LVQLQNSAHLSLSETEKTGGRLAAQAA
jgi:hypothetical protein